MSMGNNFSSSPGRISLAGPNLLTILSQNNIIGVIRLNHFGDPPGKENPFSNQDGFISWKEGNR
jgi:hypothetical protein